MSWADEKAFGEAFERAASSAQLSLHSFEFNH